MISNEMLFILCLVLNNSPTCSWNLSCGSQPMVQAGLTTHFLHGSFIGFSLSYLAPSTTKNATAPTESRITETVPTDTSVSFNSVKAVFFVILIMLFLLIEASHSTEQHGRTIHLLQGLKIIEW